jgi:hypothetical protein
MTQQGGGVPQVADPAGVQVQRLFTNFLEEYRADGGDGEEAVYVRWLQELKDAERTTLYVEFNHLLECVLAPRKSQNACCSGPSLTPRARRFDEALAHEAVETQFYRFEPYLRKAVQARRRSAPRGRPGIDSPRAFPRSPPRAELRDAAPPELHGGRQRQKGVLRGVRQPAARAPAARDAHAENRAAPVLLRHRHAHLRGMAPHTRACSHNA